jgi:hypothetical protein
LVRSTVEAVKDVLPIGTISRVEAEALARLLGMQLD